MTTIMTPSVGSKTTTTGQIDKAVADYRALLEKHAGEFDTEAVQTVLGQSEFAGEQLAIFRRRVEMISNMIIRRIRVNRSLTPQQALDATGRKQYTDRDVVNSMPHGEGDEAEVVFFKLDLSKRGGYISDNDLEKEFELRGLVSADPYSLAAVNRDDPAFADEKPNGTHWKDANGKWCFAVFYCWDGGGRSVSVDRHGDGWGERWWFAGLRKSKSSGLGV